ncbi:hypothetical protein IM45_584 [Candidatus Palibaumannia cicadellinicola]|uniref:Uncharacterized protein n=1 Tax=Candidatus Palibaumannia cicadellinicola TaxID=186490 RepID=A0A088NAL0_9GAMM|nr:hypothetical protein IM45_584 [Candidatus Baumannia cicadellinicola]
MLMSAPEQEKATCSESYVIREKSIPVDCRSKKDTGISIAALKM